MNAFLENIRARLSKSALCVGLDPEPNLFPDFIQAQDHPIFTFNQAIIDATHDLVCCYKPQIAHFAAVGAEDELEMTIDYLKEYYPDIPIILDAKRGDIGATAEKYAIEAFGRYGADALTVNPYLGPDSIEPYLDYDDTGVFVLCHTSNPGADTLQGLIANGKPIYEHVVEMTLALDTDTPVGFVVGGTAPDIIANVRTLAPEALLLIPGVGTQGGDFKTCREAGGKHAIISVSRAILYASQGKDFAKMARVAAQSFK
ncbi:MAG: orotidine-5'-phosphate decarboxylase [Gammaproteobacteria bacterium]